MKVNRSVLVAVLSVSLIGWLSGCDKGKSANALPKDTTQDTQPTYSGPHLATAEAEGALMTELEVLQGKIDTLQKKVYQRTEESKSAVLKELDSLHQQRLKLQNRADTLAASGIQSATDFMAKLNESLDVLTRSVEDEVVPETLSR